MLLYYIHLFGDNSITIYQSLTLKFVFTIKSVESFIYRLVYSYFLLNIYTEFKTLNYYLIFHTKITDVLINTQYLIYNKHVILTLVCMLGVFDGRSQWKESL